MDDGVLQLEPPTFEESVIAAFKELPGVLVWHQLARDVIIIKLRCLGPYRSGIEEIQPMLKQAFLTLWNIDRSRSSWLERCQYRLPTDDIHDGRLCRTWLLASRPMGHGWEYPWDGKSPGLFPREFVDSAPGFSNGMGPAWFFQQHHISTAEYYRMRDRQTRYPAVDPRAFSGVHAGTYQVPDIHREQMQALQARMMQQDYTNPNPHLDNLFRGRG